MSDDAAKCAGCGVRLNVGAHTFELDVATRRLFGEEDPLADQEWHCACLVRYQGGEVRVLHEQLTTARAALAEALDAWERLDKERSQLPPEMERVQTGMRPGEWTVRARPAPESNAPRIAELRAKFLGGK